MADMMSMELTTACAPSGRARKFEIEITVVPPAGDGRDPVIAVDVYRKGLFHRLNRQLFGKPGKLRRLS